MYHQTVTKSASPPRRRRRLTAPRQEEILLHGHRVSYRVAGDGPLIVLVHGITGSSAQWNPVIELLSERYTVLAPDLLGHGESAKPRGDYSLGAYAVMVRDLMVVLGHRRGTIVGHSLGGGVAMQFAYEYPVFAERLVLVDAGGIGGEVHPLLRAASLPGAEIVLPLIAHTRVLGLGVALGRALSAVGFKAGPDLAEMTRGYASLGDADARKAFLHTVRAVIDIGGQRVCAADRLYLAAILPTLIVWGERDRLIPVDHADEAHRLIPGSRLEVFEDSGHFPQLDDPIRFSRVLSDFVDTTEPTELDFNDEDLEDLRTRMLAGA